MVTEEQQGAACELHPLSSGFDSITSFTRWRREALGKPKTKNMLQAANAQMNASVTLKKEAVVYFEFLAEEVSTFERDEIEIENHLASGRVVQR